LSHLNQRVNGCLSGWVECYGDRYRSFLFIIEQEDKMQRCKGLREYVTLNTVGRKAEEVLYSLKNARSGLGSKEPGGIS
jgi:hypothetical protein